MRRRIGRIIVGAVVALLLLLLLGRVVVGFYTDVLWYAELGYLSTFWTRLGLGAGIRAVAAVLGASLVFLNLWWVARHLGPVRVRRRYGNIEIAEQIPRKHIMWTAALIAVLGGWWLAELQFGDASVLAVASWLRHVPWGVEDPLFGRDIGFYVFTLPVTIEVVEYLILVAVWTVALVALGHVLVGGIQWEENRIRLSEPARLHLGLLVAAVIVLLGVRFWIGRYLLVVDGHGVGGSLGYTDVEARLPAYWALAGLAVAAAGALVYGTWKNALLPPIIGLGGLLLAGVLLGTVLPAFVQKFRVVPNELSREAPYIRWNLEFTRRAYGLDGMTRRDFPYREAARPTAERLEPLLARLPLWDPEPLQRAFTEMQSLYQYYWFPDVDYDRYATGDGEVQVGIAVREFQPGGLEEDSRTWQSLRLNPSYIRAMGVVAAPAHPSVERDGSPTLWIRNINPVVTDPAAPSGLTLERPSVFFGETMGEYAIVVPGRDSAFTGTPDLDFPGGVPLSSFFRVLAFAWRFGDETLLFSGEVSRDSRMVFRRSVRERVEELAPFLVWDSDPLPVVHDGRVVWLVDGYTTSESFPLARAVTVGRNTIRYLRTPVKAAVDGITGHVSLYAVHDNDPVLETYRRVFPDLVQPLDSMPPGLRRHLRYPELALLTQAEILREYHLERAEAFYAGQDVWQRPQESAPRGGMREYRPTYALMPVPMEGGVEYLGMIPFIARARQNMTAALLVRNDEARYGELTLIEFPRDQQIPGPGQVQAVIEQDPVISPELSLLRQRGSGVDMGHLRVVPMDSSVLYVQPLFLSAEENPIPELYRVVVSDGRNVNMAQSLGAAMAGLELPVAAPEREQEAREGTGWPRRALDLLDRARERLRDGDWAGYGRLMEQLRALLEQVNEGGAQGRGDDA